MARHIVELLGTVLYIEDFDKFSHNNSFELDRIVNRCTHNCIIADHFQKETELFENQLLVRINFLFRHILVQVNTDYRKIRSH